MPPERPHDARDLARAWQAILGRLQVELTPHNFDTWLSGTRALRLEGDRLVAEARSSFTCDWLNERLALVVCRAAAAILGDEMSVIFVPRGTPGAGTAGALDGGSGASTTAAPVAGHLNALYTFERYLPAEGNRLAFESCASLLDDGGARVSPVVVYGPPGMGKTHLLHAVASRAATAHWQVACLSAEEFTTRYQTSLRDGSVAEFQRTLRGVRLLAVDDLQYLAGKTGTLSELVHTIDAVGDAGGAVVVASERHPADMGLPERLASRLAAGIVTRVEPFRAPERRAFIDQAARERRTALPAWAADRLAAAAAPSVRVLQGAVNAAIALQRNEMLDLRRLDAELVRITACEVAPEAAIAAELLELVAQHYHVAGSDLTGRSRKPVVTEARAAAAAALAGHGLSLPQVGAALGGRDRSTISALAGRGRELLDRDETLRRKLA